MTDYEDYIDEWVFDHLKTYGNTVIRKETVEHYGIDYLEELLTDIMGKPVTIKVSDTFYDFDAGLKIKGAYTFIAWMKN